MSAASAQNHAKMNEDIQFYSYDPKAKKKRIPPENWEPHKDVIIRKYIDEAKSLDQVVIEMEKEHEFVADRRQYIHQLGEKWRIKKYRTGVGSNGKKPAQNPSSRVEGRAAGSDIPEQDLTPDDDDGRPPLGPLARVLDRNLEPIAPVSEPILPYPSSRHLLADALSAVGDSLSFSVHVEFCQPRSDVDIFPDLLACTRAAQTELQNSRVRVILQEHVNAILGRSGGAEAEAEAPSSLSTLVYFQVARAYDYGNDVSNAIGQITRFVKRITTLDESRTRRLKFLYGRGHTLDVPLYCYLSYGLARWNDANQSINAERIVIDELLRQFVVLQLDGPYPPGTKSANPFQELPCLESCLTFCGDVLEKPCSVPEAIRSLKPTYQIFGTVWRCWILSMRSPTQSSGVSWAEGTEDAQRQLGISATELLVTVVCMIMAKAKVYTGPCPRDPIAAAVQGLQGLRSMTREAVFHLFLRQIRSNSDPRMFAPRLRSSDLLPEDANRFRVFMSDTLGMQLPAPDYGAHMPAHPLVLATADEIRHIENTYRHISSSSRGRSALTMGGFGSLQQTPHSMTLRPYSMQPGASDSYRKGRPS